MTEQDCGCVDRVGHLEPEVDWIGDWPLSHGESEHRDANWDAYCLCGHPVYLWCEAWFNHEGSAFGMTVTQPETHT